MKRVEDERETVPTGPPPTNIAPPRPTFAQVARSPARLPTPATSSTPLQGSGAGITSLRIGATTPRLRLRQSTAGLMTRPESSQQRNGSNEERPRTETVTRLSQAISTGAIPRRMGLVREEVAREEESGIRMERQKPSAESRGKESSEEEESRRAQRELELYVAKSPVVPAAAPTPRGQTRVNSGGGPPTKKSRKNKKKKSKNPPQLTKEDYVSAYLSSSDDDEPGSPIRGFFGGVYSGTAEIDWDNWSPTRHPEEVNQTPENNEDERRRGEERQEEEERNRREEMEQRGKEAREREEERRAREEEQRLREAHDDEKRLRAERAAAAAEERKRKSEKEKKVREEAERCRQEEQRTRDEAASMLVDQEQMEADPPASAATPENDMSREEAVAARNARRNTARAARRREARRIQRETREETEACLPARDQPVPVARTAANGSDERGREREREKRREERHRRSLGGSNKEPLLQPQDPACKGKGSVVRRTPTDSNEPDDRPSPVQLF
ncbi:trichohyalin-like [Nasonia vitripennis]|uniref:Uncharacterized protein n=1 Tax=Nasonia vitripennis TaxID=7425 RepID=A0A7M7R218_NASVI|nr:trichohyalin-like [Nasonia vitripennis]